MLFNYFKFVLILILINVTLISADDDGIDIPDMNSTIACNNSTKPLIVHEKYGVITPVLDDHWVYHPNASCSWTLIAPKDRIIFMRILTLELDTLLRDSLNIYNGNNENGTVIQSLSGPVNHVRDMTSKGNTLHIRFKGMSKPTRTGFALYFEHRPVPASCNSNELLCRNGIKCINIEKFACNGIDDCGDGTDEEKCHSNVNSLQFPNGCGIPHIPPLLDNLRIIGGRKAIPGSWPWQVDLRLPSEEPFRGHSCGATLINKEWVLTAGHCFIPSINPKDWQIHLGKYNRLVHDDTEVIRYIESIYLHPLFKGLKDVNETSTFFDISSNDIALIKLNAPVPINNTFVSPVCLPQSHQVINASEFIFVTGWGDVQETGNALVLKQAKIPIISDQMCHKWMPEYEIGKGMICAGYENGGHDACGGDSGGPMVHLNPLTKRWEIMGVVSFGDDPCGKKQRAGIYTKVAYYINWIEKTIQDYYKSHHTLIKKTLINELNNYF